MEKRIRFLNKPLDTVVHVFGSLLGVHGALKHQAVAWCGLCEPNGWVTVAGTFEVTTDAPTCILCMGLSEFR